MSTIVRLPNQQDATLPKHSYLNNGYGLKSWLLTGDHKRMAIVYLISIMGFSFWGPFDQSVGRDIVGGADSQLSGVDGLAICGGRSGARR